MEHGLHDRDRVGVDDFVLLENYQSEAAFIENLRKRFKENLIYTYIGQVLVSVNPYKNLPIYTPGIIKDYQKTHFYEASPHIFGLTDTAYRSLKEENKNQCILISGESGSGKTEASKKVLLFIAAATGHKKNVEVVKDKLVQSNPLLEAFGNAKTNRNVNSSRFGKYMDVQFDFLGDPVGGNILNYLLEKSRVIHQSPGERNFHIFYQLLSGATDNELKQLFLKRNFDTYFYLTDGSKGKVNNIDDVSQFKEVKKAMSVIDIPNDEQEEILKVVASILHMGNIGFTENDTVASILKPESVEAVAKLLGCNPLQLRAALLNRTIKARGEYVTSPLNRDMAICARDALAKAVYDRLFTWLVTCLNKSLQPKQTSETAVMGILDIYGFEIFQKNSFEQFCINFCNEKLQQLFIELTLKSEQEEYLKEGIEWEPVQYFNNKIICDLIEEKHKGIISLMDEECLRPGDSTDMSFLAKMNDQLINHEHYISHKKADLKTQKTMGRDEFRLIHYAGNVTYNVDGFLEKNNDLLFRDLREVMSQTTNKITKEIFPLKDLESKKRPESAATQFKNSLNNLMEILMSKEPSYIRCIKPNDDQKSNIFNDEIVTHQVKYLGLMENLRVRRAGFAYRRPYESFLERYKSLCTSTWPNYHGPAKQGVQVLVCSLAYEKDEYRMGNTKIFIRFPKTLFHTEDAFQAKKHAIAAIIQAAWKGLIQRRKYLEMRKAAIIIEKWIRRFLAKKDAEKRKKAVQVIRRFIRGFITRNDDPNSDNKNFMELAKAHWLNRLATSLPKSVLDKSWPPCPMTCRSASEFLQSFYMKYLSKKYRLALTPEIKSQFELKVLAESLFKDKKKNYKQSIPQWFKDDRVSADEVAAKNQYIVTKTQPNGEKVQYCTNVKKYDRHGYKPRQRIMILTDKTLYILETKTMKLKHSLVLNMVEFVVSSESDGVCLVRIPLELKKDKGDLILEVPHIIEAMTMIIKTTKKPNSLNIVNTGSIPHQLNNGKQGVIEVTQGTPADIHKNKNGHLIVVAVP